MPVEVVDTVVSGSLLLAFPIAVLAGLVSFLSPCVLPLVPGYLSFVTGLTGAELADPGAAAGRRAAATGRPAAVTAGPGAGSVDTAVQTTDSPPVPAAPSAARTRLHILIATGLFVAGFAAVFVSFGALFGGLGAWLLGYADLITRVLGVVVIVLGLGFMGVGAWARSTWWNRDLRIHRRPRRGLWGAPVLGVAFGLGWTPCIGPTLAAVQSLAFTEASAARGAFLSLAYSIGLGLPFLLVGLGFARLSRALDWTRRHGRRIEQIGGGLLVVLGLLLVSGVWSDLVIRMQVWVSGFTPAL